LTLPPPAAYKIQSPFRSRTLDPFEQVLQLRPLRHPDVAWRSWDGEVVILSPAAHDPSAPAEQQDGAEHDLNEVGSRIWELSDGTLTVREIAALLVEEFEVEQELAEKDAAEFVASLLQSRLLLEGDLATGPQVPNP
jgi:hypothetical protein